MKHFGLSEEDLKKPVRGDLTRAVIAARIFRETTESQQWIADQLGMKSAQMFANKFGDSEILETKCQKNSNSGIKSIFFDWYHIRIGIKSV